MAMFKVDRVAKRQPSETRAGQAAALPRPLMARQFLIAILAVAVACIPVAMATAAPFTWTSTGTSPLTDGAGTWNTAGTNWFNGTTYGVWGNTSADTATFGVGSGAAGTITVSSVTTNGITFNNAASGNYTLSSGTITMAGTTPTITVNASGTTTLSSRLAGSAGLRKTGAGTLLLGTGNTYTGTTTITQGMVSVASRDNTLGNGNGGSVMLDGGGIEISSGTAAVSPLWVITVGAGGGTLQNSSGYAWTPRNNLSGSGALTLRGPSSFTMQTTQNSFSGKWVIDGVFIDNAQNGWGTGTGDDFITLVNNPVLFSRGGTLASATQGITISSGTGTFLNAQFAAASTTIPAKLSGAGAARFIPTNGAIITLSSTGNSYAGDTLVSGTTTNRGFLRLGASEVVPDGPGKGNVFIFNGGAAASLNLNGFNETVNGLSSLNPFTSTHSTDSQVDNLLASSTATLTVGGNDASQTFAGVIQNSQSGSNAIVALTKIGSGTQTLSGANTYVGTTNINAGTLQIGAGSTTGALSASSTITGSAGATLAFNRSDTVTQGTHFASVISGAINVAQLGSGTLTLSGANTYSGQTRVSAGVLALGAANVISSQSNLLVDGGGFNLAGFSDTVGTITLTSGSIFGSGTLTSTASYDMRAGSVLANLGGSVSLTKSTAGTVTLFNANGFSGNTSISGGTLALGLNGSFNSSPTITVGSAGSSGAVLDLTAKTSGFTFGSGQTVKGIGTIRMSSGNALTINGTLAAGNSPGTLTIEGGNLVLGESSTTQYEINGTDNTVGSGTNDLTTVSGSLALGGTLNVIASPAFGIFGSRTYRVFNYATSGTGSLTGSMAIGSTPDANYLYSLNTATLGQVNLFVQRKAEQAAALAYSQPTSGTVNAFTNTNVSFSGTLANLSPDGGASLAVSLTGNAGQLAVNSLAASSGSSVAAGSSATVTGQIATGTTLGARTWTVTNTDSGAIGSQTSTANGAVNVFAHGAPTLSVTNINFGYVLVGTSTSRSVTVSNGTLGAPVSNTGGITWTSGTLPGGFTGGGANSAGVIASGSGATYSFTLATGSAGGPTGSQTFSFADDSSILGCGTLGTQSVSLIGTVLDPAAAILTGGITSGTNWFINLGEHNQGAGVFTQGFSISNLLQTLGYTADLELLSFNADPLNTNTIGITLSGSTFTTILAGGTNSYQASLALGAAGPFTNVYNLSFGSSKNGSSLGGTPQNVQLTVQGIIVVPEPSTVMLAGFGIAAAAYVIRRKKK